MSEEKKQTESYPPICPECGNPEPTVGLCSCMDQDWGYGNEDDCWDADEYPDDYDDCNYWPDDQEDSR